MKVDMYDLTCDRRKKEKKNFSIATKREALTPECIWWWTLTVSSHTSWMDASIKILVDVQRTVTPVEAEFQSHPPSVCSVETDSTASSRQPSRYDAHMHAAPIVLYKKAHEGHSFPSKLHIWCTGTVSWQLLIKENVLSSTEYLDQLLIFPFAWKKEKNTAGGAEM